MVKAVFENLASPSPKNHFTIGINDDVSKTSLQYDPGFITEAADVVGCIFYGLGADGTVGANKNSIKIIGEQTPGYAQGFFVYDSKKSGSRTISHLRFGPRPIRSTYLVQRARFIACHQFQFVERIDMLDEAIDGAVFLLNSPFAAGRGLGPIATNDAGGADPQAHPALRHRCGPCGDRRGHARPDQHDHADVLLRDLRRAAARRGDRADQGRDREDVCAQRDRNWSKRISPPSIARSTTCTKSCCRPRQPARASRSRSCPRTRPTFVKQVTAMMIAGARQRVAGQRPARRRNLPARHGAMGEAEHLRHGSGLEAGAVHPVRELRDGMPARHDSRALLRRSLARRTRPRVSRPRR